MADQRTLSTVAASFKGINFRVRTESITDIGRKKVLHEYPKSDIRFIEDMGQIPSTFSITAFIHGENWIQDSEKLQKALNENTEGRLVLSTLGAYDVFALQYSIEETQSEIGETKFNLNFAIGRKNSGPIRTEATIYDVYDLGDANRRIFGVDYAQLWLIASDIFTLVSSGFDLETLFRASLNTLANYVGNEQLAKALKIVSRMEANSASLINSAVALAGIQFNITPEAEGFFQLISTGMNEGVDPGSGVEALLSLATFGNSEQLALNTINGANVINNAIDSTEGTGVPLWPETTAARILRNRNRLTMVNSVRIAGMVIAYEQAAQREYDTKEEIDLIRESLETVYDRLIGTDSSDFDSIQAQQDVKDSINNVRLAALAILDQKQQEAYTVTEIQLPESGYTSFLLSYALYSEEFFSTNDVEERAQVIRELNLDQNANFLTQTTNVFKSI